MRDSEASVEATAQLKRVRTEQRWFITSHAVERFLERVSRMERRRVRGHLVEQCQGAHFVKPLACGLELWRGPSPQRMRLRVSRQGNVLVLESILFAFDRGPR